jgi:hypothetical protein
VYCQVSKTKNISRYLKGDSKATIDRLKRKFREKAPSRLHRTSARWPPFDSHLRAHCRNPAGWASSAIFPKSKKRGPDERGRPSKLLKRRTAQPRLSRQGPMNVNPSVNVVVFEVQVEGHVERFTGQASTRAADCIRQVWAALNAKRPLSPSGVGRIYSEWEPSPEDKAFLDATFPDQCQVTFSFPRPASDAGWDEAMRQVEDQIRQTMAKRIATEEFSKPNNQLDDLLPVLRDIDGFSEMVVNRSVGPARWSRGRRAGRARQPRSRGWVSRPGDAGVQKGVRGAVAALCRSRRSGDARHVSKPTYQAERYLHTTQRLTQHPVHPCREPGRRGMPCQPIVHVGPCQVFPCPSHRLPNHACHRCTLQPGPPSRTRSGSDRPITRRKSAFPKSGGRQLRIFISRAICGRGVGPPKPAVAAD